MAEHPPLTNFTCLPAPDHPGWRRWRMIDETRFNGAVMCLQLVRDEGDGTCRHRIFPRHEHGNSNGVVHGGITMALMDVSMFSTMYVLRGIDAGRSVTIDLQAQFLAPGDVSQPLDSVVEVLRETGRMAFLRGLVVQGENVVAAFSGTARKPSASSQARA